MNILRVGIVGCGKIADAHAEAVRYLDGALLVAACDREPLLAEQLAVRYGIPEWYADLNQMLETSRLDVLHIATPPASHLLIAQRAVEAGCHVFIEKPLALTFQEAQQIIHTVDSGGRLLSINYWPNFESTSIMLRDQIERGLIGEPVHLESFIGYDLAGSYGQALMGDPTHWVHQLPGRLFHNMMDHIFNRIIPLLPPEPLQLQAQAFRRRPSTGDIEIDSMLDELRVLVKAGPVSAYASLCSHARPVANTLRVYGTKATVELDYANRTLIEHAAQTYPSAVGRLFPPFQMARRFWAQGTSNLRAFRRSEFHFFAGMRRLLDLFYNSIRNETAPPIPYSHMLQVAEVMDGVIAQVYPGDRQ